jgi:tRNA (cmo5U34)-methyltransferase
VAARYDQGIRLSCPAYDGLQAMLAPLLRLLSPTAHVLCAGVGTGTEIITLGSRFPQWTFTAVDISADMLAVCEGRLREAGLLERVRLVHGEVDALADDASFDAATSIFVGHFIADTGRKQAYFQSIARRLRPQAPLIVSDLHGRRGSPEFVELMKAWLLYYVSHGTTREKLTADLELILRDMSFVPEEELLALLEGVGITGTVRFFQSFLFGGWIGLRAGA